MFNWRNRDSYGNELMNIAIEYSAITMSTQKIDVNSACIYANKPMSQCSNIGSDYVTNHEDVEVLHETMKQVPEINVSKTRRNMIIKSILHFILLITATIQSRRDVHHHRLFQYKLFGFGRTINCTRHLFAHFLENTGINIRKYINLMVASDNSAHSTSCKGHIEYIFIRHVLLIQNLPSSFVLVLHLLGLRMRKRVHMPMLLMAI